MIYKMKLSIWHLWKAGDPMVNISKYVEVSQFLGYCRLS